MGVGAVVVDPDDGIPRPDDLFLGVERLIADHDLMSSLRVRRHEQDERPDKRHHGARHRCLRHSDLQREPTLTKLLWRVFGRFAWLAANFKGGGDGRWSEAG